MIIKYIYKAKINKNIRTKRTLCKSPGITNNK